MLEYSRSLIFKYNYTIIQVAEVSRKQKFPWLTISNQKSSRVERPYVPELLTSLPFIRFLIFIDTIRWICDECFINGTSAPPTQKGMEAADMVSNPLVQVC